MKKIPLLFYMLWISFSCSSPGTEPSKEAEAAPAGQIDYAYLPANHPPDNWDIGDQKNVALVLKSLKAWETGNIDECITYYGDSVDIVSSEISDKFSKDSLYHLLKDFRAQLSSYKIYMEDYESVVSKDRQAEYVGLWYKEVITYQDGKVDSLYHMDDLRIRNGKIVLLDEKTRRFPVK